MDHFDQESPGPSTYEIRLRGQLAPHWFHRFEGLTITYHPDGDTLLRGPVADQAALFGILSQIRGIGIPLLYARLIAPEAPSIDISVQRENQ